MLIKNVNLEYSVDGDCTLIEACCNDYTDIVELLLKDGRSDPAYGESYALRMAVHSNAIGAVQALLKDGRVDPREAIGDAKNDEMRGLLIAASAMSKITI